MSWSRNELGVAPNRYRILRASILYRVDELLSWIDWRTTPFTGPRRTTLIYKTARPAAPCAADCYVALGWQATSQVQL
jgi:hypothetical protein